MRKRKLKILIQRIKRNKRIIDNFTHQGVSQGRMKLTCGTSFLVLRNLSDFRFYYRFTFVDLRKRFDWNRLVFEGILLRFTVSCMAVLTAWTFASATLGSSVPLLVLHRRHRRCLWHSCALLSGLNCCRFFRVRSCIPEVRNSQYHRQNRIKFGSVRKRIYFSCQRLLLSVPVCTAHHRLDIFSTRFCVLCLPFFTPFL